MRWKIWTSVNNRNGRAYNIHFIIHILCRPVKTSIVCLQPLFAACRNSIRFSFLVVVGVAFLHFLYVYFHSTSDRKELRNAREFVQHFLWLVLRRITHCILSFSAYIYTTDEGFSIVFVVALRCFCFIYIYRHRGLILSILICLCVCMCVLCVL